MVMGFYTENYFCITTFRVLDYVTLDGLGQVVVEGWEISVS